MAFDNTLAIWPSFITFVQHFVDCLFRSLWCLSSEVCGFRHNAEPPSPPLHVIKHKHYINSSAMCQWDPRVAHFLSLQWLFHWLVSILWLNMCKPVKSADGETGWIKKTNKKTAFLGPDNVVENYCTTKSRSDCKDKKKRTKTKKDVVIVLRKISCRYMLQIITVTLTFH